MKQALFILAFLSFFAHHRIHAQDTQWLIENFEAYLASGEDMHQQYRAYASDAIMAAIENKQDAKTPENILIFFSILTGERLSIPVCDLNPILDSLRLPLSGQAVNKDLFIYHYAYGGKHAFFLKNEGKNHGYQVSLAASKGSKSASADMVVICYEAATLLVSDEDFVFETISHKPFGTKAFCPCGINEEP